MGLVVIQGSYSEMTRLFLEPAYQDMVSTETNPTEAEMHGDVARTRVLVGDPKDLQNLSKALSGFNRQRYLQGMMDARAALRWFNFQLPWKEFILEMPGRPLAHKMKDLGFAYLPTVPEAASAIEEDAAAAVLPEVASFAVAWQEGVPSNFIFFHLAQAAQGVEACQMTMIIPAHLLPEQFDLRDPTRLKETTGLEFRRAGGLSQLGFDSIIRNATVEKIISLLLEGNVCCVRRMNLLASLDAQSPTDFPALQAALMAVDVSEYHENLPRATVAATALAKSQTFKSNLEKFSADFGFRKSPQEPVAAAAMSEDQQASQQQMLGKFLNYCRIVSAGFTDDHEESKDRVLRALMVLGAQYTHWNEMTVVQSLQDPFRALLEELQECLPWTLQLRPDADGIIRTEVISLEDRSRHLGLEDSLNRPRSGAQEISVLQGSYEQVIKLLFTPPVAESVFLQAKALGQQGEESFYRQLCLDIERQRFAVSSPEELEMLVAAWRDMPSDGESYLQGGMDARNLAKHSVLGSLREEWRLPLLVQAEAEIFDTIRNFACVSFSYLAADPSVAGEIKKPAALSVAYRKDNPGVWILYHVANPHTSTSERVLTVVVPQALLPPVIVAEALGVGCRISQLPAMSQHCLEPLIQNIELTEIISLLFTPTHICNPRRLVFLAGLLDTSVDNSPVLLSHKGLEGASNFYIDFQKLKRALTEVGLGRISGKLNDDDLEVLQGVLAKDPNAEDCLKALYQVVLSAKKSSDLQSRLAASETSFLPKILVYLYIRKRLDLLEKLLPQQEFPVNVALSNHTSVVLLRDPNQAFLDKIKCLRTSIDCLEKACEARKSLEKLIDTCRTIMNTDSSQADCARALLVLGTQYGFFKSMVEDPNPFIASMTQCLSERFSAAVDKAAGQFLPVYQLEESLRMPENFESEKRTALQGFLKVLKQVPQERIRQHLADLLALLKRCLPSVLEVKQVGGIPEVTMALNERFKRGSRSMPAVDLSSDGEFEKELSDLAVCFNRLEVREQRVLVVGRRFIDDCRALRHPGGSASACKRLSERYCHWLPSLLEEVTGFPEAQNTLDTAQTRLNLAESGLFILKQALELLTHKLQALIEKKEFIEAKLPTVLNDELNKEKIAYQGLVNEEEKIKNELFCLRKQRSKLSKSDQTDEKKSEIGELTKTIAQREQDLGHLQPTRVAAEEKYRNLLSSKISSFQKENQLLEMQISVMRRTQQNMQRSPDMDRAQEAKLKLDRIRGDVKVFLEQKALLMSLLPEKEAAALSVAPIDLEGDDPLTTAEQQIRHMRQRLDSLFKSKPSLRKGLNKLRDKKLSEKCEVSTADDVAEGATAACAAVDEMVVQSEKPVLSDEQLQATVPGFLAAERYVEEMLEAAKKPRLEMMSEAVECAQVEYEAARAAIDKLKDEVAQDQSLSEYQKLIQQVLAHLKRVLAYVLDENLDVFGERYEKVIFNASLLQVAVGESPAGLFHHRRTKSFSDLVVAAVVSEPVRPRSRSF